MNIFFGNRNVGLFKVTISSLLLYSNMAVISCAPENKGQRSDALAVSKGSGDDKSTDTAPVAAGDQTRKDALKPGGNPPPLPAGEVVLKQENAPKKDTEIPAQPAAIDNTADPKLPPAAVVIAGPTPSPMPAPFTCKENHTDVNEVRYVNAVNGLNLRGKPNTDPDSAIISFLLYSGKLTFHWGAGGWACVTDSVSKNIGYVSAEFLAIQKPE